jgi:class 3 adenylate cyclase
LHRCQLLPDLTDQDLVKLGIPLGHRKKLLRAIRQLADASAAAPPTVTASKFIPHDSADRRQLTVMFTDLVGCAALSARLDPEDMREIIGAYQGCCTDLITRAGGFVAKCMGDGVLAYFGYPEAHEDDAERAVGTGLALVEAVRKLKTATSAPLQARVGIATGLVVVGDLIGAGAAQEQAVVGETPNLAARLQTIAEPDRVVIAKHAKASRQLLRARSSWFAEPICLQIIQWRS